MKPKLIEHFLSLAFVGILFVVLIIYFRSDANSDENIVNPQLEEFLSITELDFTNPLHRALFKESLNYFHPENPAYGDSLLQAIDRYRQERINRLTRREMGSGGLTVRKFIQLLKMYIEFIFAYVLVLVLTYYGVQTLAVWRFVKMKQGKTSYLEELASFLRTRKFPAAAGARLRYLLHVSELFGKAAAKGVAYMILFSPAYVIAYSFKTRFDTDSFLFMIILGVISNALLITYAQKFYTFLVGESRKGYVETAIVKNLKNSYSHSVTHGIPLKAILSPRKKFPGHVFQHIFINARYQYLSTFKEQASFLISGLVIIEMALNIHGHLCYELLQNILYKQYDVVLVIVLGIFVVVKATEIFTDYWQHIEASKYENR